MSNKKKKKKNPYPAASSHPHQDAPKKSYGMLIAFCAVMIVMVGLAVMGVVNNNQHAEKVANGEYVIDLKNEPVQGNPDSKVNIIEFADFKCPYCQQWSDEIYPQLKADYIDTGKVSFHFKNFAFIGEDSFTAAVAGEAIYNQNPEAFWTYYKKMFENQGEESKVWATPDFIMNLVKANIPNLDYDKLAKDIKENKTLDEVQNDNADASRAMIQSTPSIVINNKAVENPFDYNAIKSLIDTAIQEEGK